MRRAIGFVVFIALLGGAVLIGLVVGSEPTARERAIAAFMERVPDVVGLEMSEAIDLLRAAGIEVHTASKGTVIRVEPGLANGVPAFVWLEGTEPGLHRCPSFFHSCPVGVATNPEPSHSCDGVMPFEVSYLPDGFGARLRPGAGLFKGTDYPTEGLLGHYLGPRETMHINFQTDPGPLPYEMNDTEPIALGGTNGRIAKIEGGYAVAFSFRDCPYRMDTYGVSRRETIAVARGLVGRNPSSDRCPALLPFDPGYLPEGFRRRAFVGPGQDRQDGLPPEVVHSYRGRQERVIEIHRPGTLFSELAQGDDAPTIEVLGSQTSGFGPISPGGDDFIVWFSYPADAGSHEWCKTYSLNDHGVSLDQLKKVAEGLRPRS